ncbi:MAG: hypothetical protein ABIN01_17035, partial [Ferruginibacter sp.]
MEIDPRGSVNFTLAGITQLQSVAYALSAVPGGNASGDLTGAYPAPVIANNAFTNNKIADGSISLSKLDSIVVNSIASGASALANKLNVSDTAAML